MGQEKLCAGAGKAEIQFPEGYFPQDGYSGIYTPMHARALVLESEIRVVLVSMELPSIRPFELTDQLRDKIGMIAGVPRGQVWLCMTHSLSAPHTPKETDPVRLKMHLTAVENAITEAVRDALAQIKPARFGYGEGESSVIAGREIESVDGWWIGLTGNDPTDDTLHVIRIDGEDGAPIAFVYNHALKPCVLEETDMSDGKRYASADLCGEGSRIAEEKYGVPVLFFMGAGGDVFPKKKGHYLTVGADGHFTEVCHQEEAYQFLRELGEELGNDLIATAEKITCACGQVEIMVKEVSLKVPGQEPYPRDTAPQPPVQYYAYPPAEPREAVYSLLQIGPCVVIGMKSEVATSVMTQLKSRSPFAHTMLFTMVNGGQSYIADEREYDRYEYPALHTGFGRETAEIFVNGTVRILTGMRQETQG